MQASLARTLGKSDLVLLLVQLGHFPRSVRRLDLLRARRRQHLRTSAYASARESAVLIYPVTPLLFILSAAAIVLNTFIAQPVRAAVGLAVMLLGAPAYLVWRSSAARD